jgi:hypothetical protein
MVVIKNVGAIVTMASNLVFTAILEKFWPFATAK